MPALNRTMGLLEASVYGVGLILGAGIDAILGEAVAETGESIVVSFVLAAVVATLTGLSYAELASRYPKGEGEYLYAWAAFGHKRLAEATVVLRVLRVLSPQPQRPSHLASISRRSSQSRFSQSQSPSSSGCRSSTGGASTPPLA